MNQHGAISMIAMPSANLLAGIMGKRKAGAVKTCLRDRRRRLDTIETTDASLEYHVARPSEVDIRFSSLCHSLKIDSYRGMNSIPLMPQMHFPNLNGKAGSRAAIRT